MTYHSTKMNKRKAISKKDRKLVYKMYAGHCAYCGCELELKEMQVDHFNSIYAYNGKNEIENYMPSCRQCNFYKSAGTIEQFRKHIKNTLWANLKETFQYRLALKYKLIEENDKEIKFCFELHENQVTHKSPTAGKHNENSYVDLR